MSFDGDSVSRYYSAMSGPQTPAAQLRALVRTYPSALVGYSGGVDSALLAVVLRQELGRERMLAGVGRSASYPAAQWATARAVAQRFDVPLVELDTHELEDPDYLANPTNRCFFCKTELWRRLVPAARLRGLAIVCDGTNADDLREHRPGYAAGQAAGVRSPLAEAGLTKADVRHAARELGLPVWDAPAAPCLSSRVAYGIPITSERLAQVERAEAYLRQLGVTGDLRVRHHGDRWAATAHARDLGLPVKWVRGEGLHLTLKFLGDVADEREPELAAALTRAAAGARGLALALGGFGVFPDFRRPRVVWVGIAPEAGLEILQHRVEQEFAPLGFPTEARPFRPHVTLGRTSRDARPAALTGLEAALGGREFAETAPVSALDLMQSTLQSGGPVYHVRHSERLP